MFSEGTEKKQWYEIGKDVYWIFLFDQGEIG